MNFDQRIPELNQMNSNDMGNNTNSNSLFENHLQNKHSFSMSPLVTNNFSEINRLRDELANKNAQMHNWEDQVMQANKAYELFKMENDEHNRKVRRSKVFMNKQNNEGMNVIN